MDLVIDMQPPSLLERIEFSLRQFQRHLFAFVESAEERLVIEASFRCLLAIVNGEDPTPPLASPPTTLAELYAEYFPLDLPEAPWQQSDLNPEMDRPTAAQQQQQQQKALLDAFSYLQQRLAAATAVYPGGDSRSIVFLRSTRMASKAAAPSMEPFSREDFSYRVCIGLLLRLSGGWSFRDLQKFFANVKSVVMASDRYACSHSPPKAVCIKGGFALPPDVSSRRTLGCWS